MSIGSGSCGNCYYLGVGDYGILIDAGIPSKTIRTALKKEGIPFESICAMFVTHDHADHIKSLGIISSKANIPVYATREVHEGITKNYCVSKPIEPAYVRYITKEESITLRDIVITPFEVPHDGSDNVGYFIEVGDKKFCIATDLGEITPIVSYYVDQANYLVIESNYEEQMLAMGRALMSKPDFVLMDEPSMGLSPLLVSEIFEIIKAINENGTTVLLVEQNAKKALSIADRAYVLETGSIVLSGDAKELMNDESVKKAYLSE